MDEPWPSGRIEAALADLARELDRPEADMAAIRRAITELADLFLSAEDDDPPPRGDVAAPGAPG